MTPLNPILRTDWRRVLFFHHRVAPDFLRPLVPSRFELDTYDGSAWLTLVALRMERFRPLGTSRLWTSFRYPPREQRFLNVRTYVRHRGEAGALFLWGWLSRPFHLPLPDRPAGLPCSFADIVYDHRHESGALRGSVRARGKGFGYEAAVAPQPRFEPCASGTLEEFALERYNGFYSRAGREHLFRAWHEPWQIIPVTVRITDDSLPETLGCFTDAQFESAHYAEGGPGVRLSGSRRAGSIGAGHGPSSLFALP